MFHNNKCNTHKECENFDLALTILELAQLNVHLCICQVCVKIRLLVHA